MEAVLIMMIIMSVPLSAILGNTYLKAQKLKAGAGLTDADKKKIKALLEENEELTERVENLETIMTSLDPELLTLKAHQDAEENQKRLEALAQKLNPKALAQKIPPKNSTSED